MELTSGLRRVGAAGLDRRRPGRGRRQLCLRRAHEAAARHQHHRRLGSEKSEARHHHHAARQQFPYPQGAGGRRHHDRQCRDERPAFPAQRREDSGCRARSWKRSSSVRPTDAEIAAELHVKESDIPRADAIIRSTATRTAASASTTSPIASNPKLLVHHRTHGFGTHRFDMDERYAYISTEMPGYVGNILVVYDIKDPTKPEEVSRWWMPGQHVAGGEKPTWRGYSHRLHHAMRFGNEFWASVWFAGMRVLDCSDITKLKVDRRSTITIRPFRSRRIRSCRFRTSSTAAAMPPRWTRSTTISPASRMPACGSSTWTILRTSSRWRCSTCRN